LCLGLLEPQSGPASLFEGLPNLQLAALEVDGVPAQCAKLAPAHPGAERHNGDRVKGGAAQGLEHHWDSLRAQHRRFLRSDLRRIDLLARITLDVALPQGMAEHSSR